MPTICDREVSDDAIKNARDMAEFYRSRGYQPLPSRPDEKRPLVAFKEFWESPTPADLFDRHPTSNIQLICGRRWKLLVVDLDGVEAQKMWPMQFSCCAKTWITHSGGNGQHWWFRLPENYPTPLLTGFLWKGEDKHSGIERICDHGLIMVPPSIHPGNGRHYKFLKWHSPQNIPMPARCPEWLLKYPLINPAKPPTTMPARQPQRKVGPIGPRSYDLHDVLAAIPDKVAIAESWGLRVAARSPTQKGWIACHAIDREDVHPSAAINVETGMYVDRGGGRLKFFELAATIGGYTDWKDAVQLLGDQYLR